MPIDASSADSRPRSEPEVSVVVPTYQERDNLDELINRVSATLDRLDLLYEIIVVDDESNDGTDREIERLQQSGRPVRLVERRGERGLSSAVLRGFAESRGQWLVCMDADLSHPPEALPSLLAEVGQDGAEMAIGSRYVPGASTDETWGVLRRLNSRVATLLARPFTRLKDPMAGYFALPRSVFQRTTDWDPVGYKIGLEILVKSGCRNVREVPIHFENRRRGRSKLSWREQVNYLRHLARLARYKFGVTWQLTFFCGVGASGAVVDLSVLALLLQEQVALPVARGSAIAAALVWNFIGHDSWTFRFDRDGRLGRFAQFTLACSLGALLSYSTSLIGPRLWPVLAGYPLLTAALGILVGTASNFLVSRYWVFAESRRGAPRQR
jgi:dolichol-phosphate mannosyltransferase